MTHKREEEMLNIFRDCDPESQEYLIAKAKVLKIEGISGAVNS